MPAPSHISELAVQFLEKKLKSGRLSKRQLSILLGVNPNNIVRWLNRTNKPSEDFVSKIIETFPEAKEELGINTQNIKPHTRPIGEINHDDNGKKIPVIDTDVYASIVGSLSSSYITMPPKTFISIPFFSEGECAVQVTGHSMKGYINNGDWVVIKRLTNHRTIIYGEPYLVVTKSDNIKTVKFLKPAEDEDCLTLVPYNIEQFEPQDIQKDDVLSIYRVIGLFRSV